LLLVKLLWYLCKQDIVYMFTKLHDWRIPSEELPCKMIYSLVTRNGDSKLLAPKWAIASTVEYFISKFPF